MPNEKITLNGAHAIGNVAQLIDQYAEHLLGKGWQLLASDSEKFSQPIDLPDPSGGNDAELSKTWR